MADAIARWEARQRENEPIPPVPGLFFVTCERTGWWVWFECASCRAVGWCAQHPDAGETVEQITAIVARQVADWPMAAPLSLHSDIFGLDGLVVDSPSIYPTGHIVRVVQSVDGVGRVHRRCRCSLSEWQGIGDVVLRGNPDFEADAIELSKRAKRS